MCDIRCIYVDTEERRRNVTVAIPRSEINEFQSGSAHRKRGKCSKRKLKLGKPLPIVQDLQDDFEDMTTESVSSLMNYSVDIQQSE